MDFQNKIWTAVQNDWQNGWWVVEDEYGVSIDESADGGFEKETAERIALCLNFCKNMSNEELKGE